MCFCWTCSPSGSRRFVAAGRGVTQVLREMGHKAGLREGPWTPQSLEPLHSFSLLVVVTLRQTFLCDGPRGPITTTRNALLT